MEFGLELEDVSQREILSLILEKITFNESEIEFVIDRVLKGLRGFGEMTDQELELELNEARMRLGDPPSSVNDLLGILDSMRNAMEPSLKALASENIREHSDVDVKVAVASRVSEITRITAPDAPFEDEQMRDLAKGLLDTFTARQMGKVFFTNSGSEANDSQNDGSEYVVPVQQHNYPDLEMEYEASKVAFDYNTTTSDTWRVLIREDRRDDAVDE
ncbi:hypothetical protein Syun_028082 [Stephania yunnanensis]|uniref:Uncharacterized protein n=1 Tax=Stephania yunnanensis TaxID=152371 RepID=A0AAP0EGP8_9MAGN